MYSKPLRDKTNRRSFIKTGGLAAGALAGLAAGTSALAQQSEAVQPAGKSAARGANPGAALSKPDMKPAVDFRYAPRSWQTAYCFPDDPRKSLVGERGELRIGHPGQGQGIDLFPVIVEFSLNGMEKDQVLLQRLESGRIPVVHTIIERPEAMMELITFATNSPGEGWVDNVIIEIKPRTKKEVHAIPTVTIRTNRELKLKTVDSTSLVSLDKEDAPPFLVVSSSANVQAWLRGAWIELLL
jgi:hypothetical protein